MSVKFILFSIFLLIFSSLYAQAQDVSAIEQAEIQEAKNLLATQQGQMGFKKLRELIKKNPNQVEAYELVDQIGLHQVGGDAFFDLMRTLEKAVKTNPDNPSINYALGKVYFRFLYICDAKNSLEKARLGAKDKILGGKSLDDLIKDVLKQIEDAETRLKISKEEGAEGYINRGLSGDVDQKMVYFSCAVHTEPNNPKIALAYAELGGLSVYGASPNSAEYYYKKALQLDPNLKEAQEGLQYLSSVNKK